MALHDPVEALLSRLESVRKSGQGWTARCPSHEDRTASLSVNAGEDAALYVTGRDIEREQDYALAFDTGACTWASSGTVHSAQMHGERQRILSFIEANGPSKPRDIAMGLGKKGTTTRRLLQKMFADGEIRVDEGRYSLIHTSVNGVNRTNSVPDDDNVHAVHTDASNAYLCASRGF